MLGGGLSSAFIEEDIYLFILFGGAPRLEGINLTRQDKIVLVYDCEKLNFPPPKTQIAVAPLLVRQRKKSDSVL